MLGSKLYIIKTKEHFGIFLDKEDEGILVGYSSSNRAYRAYNKKTFEIEDPQMLYLMKSLKYAIEDLRTIKS